MPLGKRRPRCFAPGSPGIGTAWEAGEPPAVRRILRSGELWQARSVSQAARLLREGAEDALGKRRSCCFAPVIPGIGTAREAGEPPAVRRILRSGELWQAHSVSQAARLLREGAEDALGKRHSGHEKRRPVRIAFFTSKDWKLEAPGDFATNDLFEVGIGCQKIVIDFKLGISILPTP